MVDKEPGLDIPPGPWGIEKTPQLGEFKANFARLGVLDTSGPRTVVVLPNDEEMVLPEAIIWVNAEAIEKLIM